VTGYWLMLFIATHIPRSPIPASVGISDKLQHYVAYAILAFLASWWVAVRRPFTTPQHVAVLASMALYGAADEILQSLVGRETDYLDWRADMIGAATGLILFSLSIVIRRRIKKPTESGVKVYRRMN
jgi:VanZ family protein